MVQSIGNFDNTNSSNNNNNNDSKSLYTIMKNKKQTSRINNSSNILSGNGKTRGLSFPLENSINAKNLDSYVANKVFNLNRSGSPTLPNFGSLISSELGNNQFPKKKNSITEIVEGNVLVQHGVAEEEEDIDEEMDLTNSIGKPVLKKNNSWVNMDSQPLTTTASTLKLDTSILANDSDTMSECNSAIHDDLNGHMNNTSKNYLDQSLETLYKKYTKINKLEDARIKNGSSSKYIVNGNKDSNENPFSISISKQSVNYKRNRYSDISPYNYNRVKLQIDESFDEDVNNDYINASYIKLNCLNEKDNEDLIASQGPTKNTYKQFWQMCFEEAIKKGTDEIIIVMVTPLVENHREKCYPYWPSKPTEELFNQKNHMHIDAMQTVGTGVTKFSRDLEINVLNENYIDSYYYTLLQATDLTNGHSIKVHHLYYDKWEDFSSPNSSAQIISLIDHINSIKFNKENVPIVSHCSAGVGRTGTFFALFYLYNCMQKGFLQESELKDPIEATIKQLRLCRMKMVQTFDQFQFIYKVIKQQMGQ